MKRIVLFVFVLLLLSLGLVSELPPVAANPAEIVVPDDYEKIQWAINNASDGDTIFVRADTYYENVVVNKTVSLLGENRIATIIDGSGKGTVIKICTTNVSINGFTVQNGYYGIYFDVSKGTITKNTIRNNFFGIYLSHSKYNYLSENIVENNYYGIYSWGSGSNTISKNVLNNNDHGIDLWEDSSNIIIENIVRNNGAYGIYAYHSHMNIVSENTLTNNDKFDSTYSGYAIWLDRSNGNKVISNMVVNNTDGIFVYDSRNNIVRRNTIVANQMRGVMLGGYLPSGHYYNNTICGNTIQSNNIGIDLYQYANNNKIYHNNFIDNKIQAYIDEFTSNNTWDNGFPSGGNYWSDYNGTDLFNGPYQNEIGSDGIGDTACVIDENNQDNYPLMQPYSGPIRNLNTGQSYPVIQGAINNASEGDRIFALSGTYYENVVVNKTISLMGENRGTTIIDGNRSGISVLILSNDVIVSGFTIRSGREGVFLNRSRGNIISGNFITSNVWYGIELVYSNANIISSNHIVSNGDGVPSLLWGGGIILGASDNNTIMDNIIANNVLFEIELQASNNNTIVGNTLGPLELGAVISNKGLSLLYSSNNNTIYHNSIVGGQIRCDNQSSWNIWDNGYEGNYWGNYWGDDENGNGIGDTDLPHQEVDYYPLMSPYIPGDVNHNGIVDIYDAVKVAKAYGSKSTDPNWNPHTDLIQDRKIDMDDLKIIKKHFGKTVPPYFIDENNQYNYQFVPEFPTWTSMLLILIVLTVAIAIYRRRLFKTSIH